MHVIDGRHSFNDGQLLVLQLLRSLYLPWGIYLSKNPGRKTFDIFVYVL